MIIYSISYQIIEYHIHFWRSHMLRSIRLALVVSVVTVVVFCLCFFPTTKASTVTTTITLDSTTVEAKVGEGETGLATVTGNVTIEIIGVGSTIQQVYVYLNATCASWPVTVSPESMILTQLEPSKPFTVGIKVPNDLPNGTTQQFYISGTAQPVPGATMYNIPEAVGMVIVHNVTHIEPSKSDKDDNKKSSAIPGPEGTAVIISLIVLVLIIYPWHKHRR